MTYDDMPSGREMDALVAEKVMGWKREGKGDHTKPHHRESLDFPGEIINDWGSKGEHDYLVSPSNMRHYLCACKDEAIKDHIDLPEYSSDISAAWEVVEKFQEVSIEHEYGGNTRCEIMVAGGECFCSHAPTTAPLAICRAALKAVL